MTDTYVTTKGERWICHRYALVLALPSGQHVPAGAILAELRAQQANARRLFTALAACVAERERELGDYEMRDIWSGASQAAAALLEELRARYGGTT